MTARGRRFYKMSGSGNDFVVFDARDGGTRELRDPARVRRLCARGTGVGADGLVVIDGAADADFRMSYLNRDGSAAMCGNAALCAARLAAELGLASPRGMRFVTDAGVVEARVDDGGAEVDLAAVRGVTEAAPIALGAGERRIGFADPGVPHLVVDCDDVRTIDLERRGPELRGHAWCAAGANANFVSAVVADGADGARWAYRTFERGVEAETLACGTGAVAVAVLLNVWGVSGAETRLRTSSGATLTVALRRRGGDWVPTLRGEGRLVFVGELREL